MRLNSLYILQESATLSQKLMNEMVVAIMIRASQIKQNTKQLRIGIEEIDRLIGGFESGNTYLFYGDEEFIDELVHRLMVIGAKQGKVAYMNNTDYHTAKTLLDFDRIAYYAKREGVEPMQVMHRVIFAAAYNELRQPIVAEVLEKRIDNDFVMLIVHNITRFLADSKDRRSATESIDISLSKLWHIAMQKMLIMIITCDALEAQHGNLPLLRNANKREAFERLVRDAWDKEHAAMANSQLPLVLDAMNLTANLHNSAEINQLAEEVKMLRNEVEELKRRISEVV